MKDKLIRIARNLCDGLGKTKEELDFVAERLGDIANENHWDMDTLEGMCWEDSNTMFDLIYCR